MNSACKAPYHRKEMFIISVLLIVGLQSCKLPFGDDEPTAPIEYVYVDDDFWSYVGLPENSYWIYREIHTGEIDSSYSGGITYELRDPGQGRYRLKQLEEYRIGSLLLRGKKFSCSWYTAKGAINVDQIIRKRNYFAQDQIETGSGMNLAYKDSIRDWEENDLYEQIYTTWHDTLILRKTEYRDVVQIETGDLWENPAFIVNTYYVKDIGAVYRKFGDGSEWELIRYKIGLQLPREYTKRQY